VAADDPAITHGDTAHFVKALEEEQVFTDGGGVLAIPGFSEGE
jgi:hypothetical protein